MIEYEVQEVFLTNEVPRDVSDWSDVPEEDGHRPANSDGAMGQAVCDQLKGLT